MIRYVCDCCGSETGCREAVGVFLRPDRVGACSVRAIMNQRHLCDDCGAVLIEALQAETKRVFAAQGGRTKG